MAGGSEDGHWQRRMVKIRIEREKSRIDSQVTGLPVVTLLSEMRKARGGTDLLGYQIQ